MSELGQKLPIDRPCSACGDGDYAMEHHLHYPPFRQPIASSVEPPPSEWEFGDHGECPVCGTDCRIMWEEYPKAASRIAELERKLTEAESERDTPLAQVLRDHPNVKEYLAMGKSGKP